MKSFLFSICVLALASTGTYANSVPKPFSTVIPHPPPHKPTPTPKPMPPTTSLTEWSKEGVAAIFQSVGDAAFNNAVDCFFDPSVAITFNGSPIPLSSFVGAITEERVGLTKSIFGFFNSLEVPLNQSTPHDAGSVGLFYNNTLIRTMNGTTTSSWSVASINILVSPDTSAPGNCSGDPRRAKVLSRVSSPLSTPQLIGKH